MSEDENRFVSAPAFIAPVAIMGGLLSGLLAVLITLMLIYGPEMSADILQGQHRIPATFIRAGALVMVLMTGLGMYFTGVVAERIWRSRR